MANPIILDNLIQQSGNDVGNSTTQNLVSFTEVYKGPWTTIKDLPTVGGFLVGVKRQNVMSGSWDSKFAAPAAPYGRSWFLSQITTNQLEAGDHGEVRLTWDLNFTDIDVPDPDSPDLSTVTTNWECSWNAESKSILAYCSSGSLQTEAHNKAYAGNIKMWAEEENAQLKAKNSFQFDGKEYKLNDIELSIGQLYVKDVNPVFHNPIITKVTTQNVNQLSSINVKGIDKISDPRSPFTFDQNTWTFIKLGNDVQYEIKRYYSKTLSAEQIYYTLTTKEYWAGHKNPRTEFYGKNAWKIGEM